MYKKMYLHLFNAVTDSLEAINQMDYGKAHQMLIRAQEECEEIYLDAAGGAESDEKKRSPTAWVGDLRYVF